MATVPYQPKVFCAFIAAVGRLFYEDAAIILLDFLSKEQRAFSEAEMKEVLNWRESLLMQQLAKLEQQLLVEKIIEAERGSRTMYLWRLHPQVCLAVAWRLKALMEQLQLDVDSASQQSALVCPQCTAQVSLLDAACGPKALEDDHPLCKNCSVKLTTCNSEQARQHAEDRLARAHKQLAYLQEFVTRVSGMEVPSFTSEKYEATEPAVPGLSGPDDSGNSPSNQTSVTNEELRSKQNSSAGGKSDAGESAPRAIPWFMTSQQQTTQAPEQKAQQDELSSVSFGRSHSRVSLLSTASAVKSGSSVLNKTVATNPPGSGGITPLSMSGIAGRSTMPVMASTPRPPSMGPPSFGAGGSFGVSMQLSGASTGALNKGGGAKPFSLSLKSGPKSDLSDGSGNKSGLQTKLLKRPAESTLSKAFDKKVRF